MSEAGEFIDEVDEDADDEMVREETLKNREGCFRELEHLGIANTQTLLSSGPLTVCLGGRKKTGPQEAKRPLGLRCGAEPFWFWPGNGYFTLSDNPWVDGR